MNKKEVLKMKPSAYRSMLMGKLGLTKATKKETQDLLRWNKGEKWQNLTPKAMGDNAFYECGRQSKEQKEKGLPSVCRPSVKINEKTPKPLAKELTKEQIKKAIEIKKKGGRINWQKL